MQFKKELRDMMNLKTLYHVQMFVEHVILVITVLKIHI